MRLISIKRQRSYANSTESLKWSKAYRLSAQLNEDSDHDDRVGQGVLRINFLSGNDKEARRFRAYKYYVRNAKYYEKQKKA